MKGALAALVMRTDVEEVIVNDDMSLMHGHVLFPNDINVFRLQ